jgi:hypothetical protein
MASRALILLRARLAAGRDGARLPIASLFMQAFAATALCALTPPDLPPFAAALFGLCAAACLVAIPLFGELGDLLVRDEADAWVSALPVEERDLRLARLGHLGIELGLLTLGAILPAAVLLDGLSPGQRLGLVLAALAQSACLAACLSVAMGAFARRASALLVLLQSSLFLFAIVGGTLALRHMSELRQLASPVDRGLYWLPSAWFAAPFATAQGSSAGWAWSLAGVLASAAALAALLFVPAPRLPPPSGAPLLLGRLLAPLRNLALRLWVRPRERGVFELVFEGLPREREFVLRTYPLVGLPLAFLVVGMRGEDAAGARALLALLLFTPGVYLPVLLAHVPVSASHRARWILDGAPIARADIDNGAIKAVTLRFLVPLYGALSALAWFLCGPVFTLHVAPVTFLVTLAVVRQVWRAFGIEKPLSTAPDNVAVEQSWFNAMMVIALLLTVLAVFAERLLASPWVALAAVAVLLFLEWSQDRALSREARDTA